jgi:hypothetical protein
MLEFSAIEAQKGNAEREVPALLGKALGDHQARRTGQF